MKNLFLNVLLLSTTASFAQATTTAPCLTIEGTLQKTAIYFQNPENGDGEGFCTDSVFVNEFKLEDSLFNQSAFEIDFTQFGLEIGNPVVIKVYHADGCKPKLLTNGCPPQPNGVQFLEIKVE